MNNKILSRYSEFTSDYNIYRTSPPIDIILTLKKLSKSEKLNNVVDIGSGIGLSTRIWSLYTEEVIGIEPSVDMIAEAKKNTTENNVRYINEFGHKTGLPDNSADIVTASSAIHWMEPESTVNEIKRILRKGGVFGAYGYRYPLFPNEWKLHALYKEFRINLDFFSEKISKFRFSY